MFIVVPICNLKPPEEKHDNITIPALAEGESVEKSESNSGKKEFPAISNIKTILSLSPLALAFAFASILSYYSWVVNGDAGTAFQMASIQVAQDKYRLISSALVVLLICYLALLPAIISGKMQDLKNNSQSDIAAHLNNSITLTLRIVVATFLSAFLASFIFRTVIPDQHGLYLLYFTAFTFIIGQAASTINLPSNTLSSIKNFLTHDLTLPKALISLIIFVIMPVFQIDRFQEISIRTGEAISASKSGNLDPMQAYSCVFPKNESNNESIAFGIIAPSTISSLHIFTPEFSQKDKKYTHITDGKIFPNNPIESYINIKIDYTIEKYDPSKHEFNSETGKCKHKMEN